MFMHELGIHVGIQGWLACPTNTLCNAATYFGLLAGMAWIGTVVATVNPAIRPFLFGGGYGPMTCGIGTNVDLVLQGRHELASIGRVMDFMITIGLGVLVDDKSWHRLSPWLRHFLFFYPTNSGTAFPWSGGVESSRGIGKYHQGASSTRPVVS